MKRSELTAAERGKVGVKSFLSWLCILSGAFHVARWITSPGVTIIIYHRIIMDDHEGVRPYISVTRSALRRQLRFFKKYYAIISLEEGVERLRTNRVDRHYVCLTFDDGYSDNYSLGVDIFVSEGVQPTIFVTTSCVEKQQLLWPDVIRQLLYDARFTAPVRLVEPEVVITPEVSSRIRAAKSIIAHVKTMDVERRSRYLNDLKKRIGPTQPDAARLMLNWGELHALKQAGAIIGSHTVNHPVLSSVPDDAAAAEITESKRILEAKLGGLVTLFAYPNGGAADFTEATVEQVKKAGYWAAVTTIRGVNRRTADPFRLRRTGIYLTDTIGVIKLKLAAECLLRG